VDSAAARAGSITDLLAPLRDDPSSSAIFCDIDGTLAPIVERAPDAAVPEAARSVLGPLAGRYALVGCLSGRRATAARELVGLEELTYIGNHGFERLLPGSEEAELDPAVGGHAGAAAAFAEHLDAGELASVGLRIEDKGPIFALHWRGAADEAAAKARAREVAIDAVSRNLVPHWGRKVVELRPAVGIDKGTALGALLEERKISRALYGGDDTTDLDAFRALREMRAAGDLRAAVCIGVASAEGPPELGAEADVMVEGTDGFLAVLRLLGG
jgi:trehalose 6-phosphate phosphatase